MKVFLFEEMKPIDNPDITNIDPKYWAKVLKSHNLKVTRGTDEDFICYVGGNADIQRIDENRVRKVTGKHKSPGHGSDN